MKQSANRSAVIRSVKGRDLPDAWARKANAAPDDLFSVYIEAEDGELAAARTLEDVTRIIRARALNRGLTQEKLDDILKDA